MSISTILILIPVAAAIAACIAETRIKDKAFPYNVTRVGWFLVALAATSAVLNILSNRDKATANAIRESLGLRQIETATYLMLSPQVALSDPPELEDRFRVATKYADIAIGLCDVDISSVVDGNFADPQYNKAPWGVYITERTREGVTQLSNAQASYGTLLSDDINLLIGKAVSHPWNEFLMETKRRTVAGTKKPLCSDSKKLREAYEKLAKSYAQILAELEQQVGRRHCSLRQQIALNDTPPLFLRSISGFIYAPNPEEIAPIMQKLCSELTAATAPKP
jgi:hypothetical protein